MAWPADILVKTMHVPCPDCGTGTFGPYMDPSYHGAVYFDGHYCEDCGKTWRWDEKSRAFRPTFG